MALWKPFRGNRMDLDTVDKHDGYVYFCVDDGSLFFDYLDSEGNLQRQQINAKDAETLTGISLDEIKNEITNQDVLVLAEAQAYTDNAISLIPTPDVSGQIEAHVSSHHITEEETLELLMDMDVVQPLSNANNTVYTDNNNKLYVL